MNVINKCDVFQEVMHGQLTNTRCISMFIFVDHNSTSFYVFGTFCDTKKPHWFIGFFNGKIRERNEHFCEPLFVAFYLLYI